MGLFSRTKDRKQKKAAKEAQASTVSDADVSTGTKTTVVEAPSDGTPGNSTVVTEPVKTETPVEPVKTEPEQPTAELVGKDFADSWQAMPDGEEKVRVGQQGLTQGKVAWQDFIDAKARARKYLDENGNVDQKKIEEEEKRQKRNRNIIGITNMIGALGNLANATSSRDGRSVEVANLVKPYDEAQQKEYDKREKSLKRLRDAQKNYGDVSANIINQGWKDYQTRKQREFDNAIKEQGAKDKAAKAAADLRAANARAEQAEAQAIIAKGKAATAEETARLDMLLKKARIRQAETSASNSRKSNIVPIAYENGAKQFNISKDKWNSSNIGKAWSTVPLDIQDKIINSLVDDIDSGDSSVIAETADPETQAAFGQAANAGSKAAKKKQITENKALLEIAIGMAVDEEGTGALKAFLANLAGQKYEDPDDDFSGGGNGQGDPDDFR